MQLFPIVLVAVVLAAAGRLELKPGQGHPDPVIGLVVACAPVAGILLLTWAGTAWCCRRIDRGRGSRLIVSAERMSRWSRTAFLVNHALAVLLFGWLEVVRGVIGDPILLDEFITMLPPIVGFAGAWWIYYPVESRLRRALLIRQLDSGQPVYSTPSRVQYVLMQSRLGLLLLLVPLLIIMGLSEMIRWAVTPLTAEAVWVADMATLVAALLVFLYTPLLARRLLHLTPLPAGLLRDDLLEICARHRVRVRDVLLWRTSGSMINAAVMGLLGRLRYVLLTDVLLETLSRRQVQAVMAHEIGHVRRHHIPWLLACLLACVALSEMLIGGSLYVIALLGADWPVEAGEWLDIAATIAALIIALQLFGWVSRRFERQADTFAVAHLSQMPLETEQPSASDAGAADPPSSIEPDDRDAGVIRPEAAGTLQSALSRIARLNAVDTGRRSWRHGSIAWRQRHLQSIIGRLISDLPGDRTVKRIKIAAVIVLLAAGLFAVIRAMKTGG